MATTYAIPDGRVAMAATTYAGTGASASISNAVNGVSFQPDLVWIKDRTAASSHQLYDRNRGTTSALSSNLTNAEYTVATGLTAFNSNGFTVVSDSGVNLSGRNYVGWQWKAGGTAVSNTAGSITSSVSANTTAGFSVVTYTGTGANATVGHGLGVAPAMMIFKPRNAADNWPVWHKSFAVNEYVYLNLTVAKTSLSTFMNSTLPNSSIITLGSWANTNANANTMVAYCFAEVAGFSKFGSYIGNGSADGPFVYLGFRPRWVMAKLTSGADRWGIVNSASSPYNEILLELHANNADAEGGAGQIDFTSTGFKMRSNNSVFNSSGGTYIYMAFAENPFKYANAR